MFVSLGTLALCALVLAFADEEVQAQQLPQAQHRAIGEQGAENISQTTLEATPTDETSSMETRLERTSPIEPTTQPALVRPVSAVEELSPAASDPTPAVHGLPVENVITYPEPVSGSALRSDPVSGSTIVPAEQDAPNTSVGPYLAPPDPRSTPSEPAAEPASGLVPVTPVDPETALEPVETDHSPLDPEPKPVTIGESNPSRCSSKRLQQQNRPFCTRKKRKTLTSLTS
jgi:hypothetical protein